MKIRHLILSGLSNRRHFDILLRREVEKANNDGASLALSLMRVDGFEKLVERVGRPVGDALLRLLGMRIQESMLPKGMPARFGNDQFAILLAGPNAEHAFSDTDSLRLHISKRNFSIRGTDKDVGTVTMSCAVCMLREGESAERFVSRTLSLLEDAERQGGNLVLS